MTREKIHKHGLRVVSVVLGVALAGLFIVNEAAAREPTSTVPRQFIKALAQNAIAVLDDRQATLENREKTFRVLLTENFAMKQLSRFVVGRHWRRMTPQQREKYGKLFEDWVVKYYSIRLNRYSDLTLRVIRAKAVGKKDVLVNTRFEGPTIPTPLQVHWRIRPFESGLRIIDVIVEGVSMAVMQRADFTAIIEKRGVEGFLQQLKTTLSELEFAQLKDGAGS